MNAKVSRGYYKLEHALKEFKIDVKDKICADLGSSTGGFVECLLDNGAQKVYAIEKGYGVLDWKLRNDKRVIVMERTNALHAELPEKTDLVTIDASWTRQSIIIPKALDLLKPGGTIISLIKPHYEADKKWLNKGKLEDTKIDDVIKQIKNDIENKLGDQLSIKGITESPITGAKGGNKEFLMYCVKTVDK